MRDVKADVSNQIAIAEFRFEDASGGNFRVFFRRQLGWSSLFVFVVLMFLTSLGLLFLWGVVKSTVLPFFAAAPPVRAAGTTRPSKGSSICCVPFVLGFVGLWLSVPLRVLRAHWRATMGREVWTFGTSCISPFADPLREEPEFPMSDDIRAGLSQFGTRWVLGISSGARQLLIGPFTTRDLARDFEQELRRRKPTWFAAVASTPVNDPAAHADDRAGFGATATPFALPEVTPARPAEPIRDFQILPVPGGFDLIARRDRSVGRFGGAAFLMVWLCGWALGEVLASAALYTLVFKAPDLRGGSAPPGLFLLVWLTFWTFGGIMAMRQVSLQVRRTERWRFRQSTIIAGRSWAFPRTRTLPDTGAVHARVIRTPAGTELEFISAGVSLRLGPIPNPTVARDLVADLRRYRPSWTWHAAPPAAAHDGQRTTAHGQSPIDN